MNSIEIGIINKSNILNNKLLKKLDKKTYLLQYLPNFFYEKKENKFIVYKDKKLKIDYLIDLVSNLILKYYYKQENSFKLNSLILKDKYGTFYNYYIDYLLESDILVLKSKHKKGLSSRTYQLDNRIFNDINLKYRYKNKDKILLKKYKKRILEDISHTNVDNNLIDDNIKQKLISDLFDVNIDISKSIFYIESLDDNNIDIYNRNVYSIDSIDKKHIFYHFDEYGRMHTNYTILKSYVRKNYIFIDDDDVSEIDIPNSQPLFLTKLILNSNTNWINKDELNLFTELTTNGCFYEYLTQNLNIDRGVAKKMTYNVLFGRNIKTNKHDINFYNLFPTIYNFIKLYKKSKGNYKILAYDLQRMESNFIFNKVVNEIIKFDKNIKIITIHDSIVFQKKYNDVVKKIFDNELKKEFNF